MNGTLGKYVNFALITLILLNVLAVIVESIDSLALRYHRFFQIFELISVIVFSVEYILRVYACVADNKYRSPINGRIRFAFSPLAIIDLLAIAPFYLPMILPLDLRILRALRLFRLFRILKIGRYSNALSIMGSVIRKKREELIITIISILLLLILASALMYYLERETQPDVFSSIPAAMWWGIITLSTVGYGDVYPVTMLGKLLGTVVALLGIGMFALPAGILGSGFLEEIVSKKQINKICPHCGKKLEKP
ncbi:MAG: ion transporter [FCB group bacterium]|nr:ion transporter [FCB group bacterium]